MRIIQIQKSFWSYQPNEYNENEFIELENKIKKNLLVGDIVSIFNYFGEWKLKIMKRFSSLLGVPDNDDDGWDDGHEARNKEEDREDSNDEYIKSLGWLNLVYFLSEHLNKLPEEILEREFIITLHHYENILHKNNNK